MRLEANAGDRYLDAMQQGGRDAAGERARRRAQARSRAVRNRRAGLAALILIATPVVVLLAAGGSHSQHRAHGHAPAANGRAPSAASATSGAGPRASAESARVRALIALGMPIYCAARGGNEVALTFDDGPGPYTRLMLAKLHKHHVRATFFDVGRNIPLLPRAIGEEREAGGVGDHTFTHPLLTALAPAQAQAEIVRTQTALQRAGAGPVFLFRPPYGGRDEAIDHIARANGMLEIMWTVDSADSLGADWAQIERNVIAGLRGGAIILMHENHGQTIRAMLGIFAALQRKHLRTVSVARLLSDDPPSVSQVRAGGGGCGVNSASLRGG